MLPLLVGGGLVRLESRLRCQLTAISTCFALLAEYMAYRNIRQCSAIVVNCALYSFQYHFKIAAVLL